MLISLSIEGFALVKQLELDFSSGMTAFTGETGAGKSIMIDALLLALGERAESSVIRPGHNHCQITACFHYEVDSPVATWLSSHSLDHDETLYLRRIIAAEGRSKSYINGQPFPLQKLKELSELLVHVHGQHQHQALMQHATHRQQLDDYAGHEELLTEVAHSYKQVQKVKAALDLLQQREKHPDRIQWLLFQIEEIAALKLQQDEMPLLSQEHKLLHHAQSHLASTQNLTALLHGEDGPNLLTFLNQALLSIKQLPVDQKPIQNAMALLESALIQCEEALNEIEQFAAAVSIDPERCHEIETRMSAIHHLARKYHIDSNQLLAHQQHLETELATLQGAQNNIQNLEEELVQLRAQFEVKALQLRASRQAHAEKLAQEITARMQTLGMPQGFLEVSITPLDKMHVHGLDKVVYQICTNPGMSPDSLSKIASGGELSRIALAIQTITAQRTQTATLLFDEVDVGIGGATAALVGKMLRQLGQRVQVFCVTHQPQVAACAHQQFKVEKHSDAEQTQTKAHQMDPTERTHEIARMLGGLTLTEQAHSHAQELLNFAILEK